jgi:hypothetical protein
LIKGLTDSFPAYSDCGRSNTSILGEIGKYFSVTPSRELYGRAFAVENLQRRMDKSINPFSRVRQLLIGCYLTSELELIFDEGILVRGWLEGEPGAWRVGKGFGEQIEGFLKGD